MNIIALSDIHSNTTRLNKIAPNLSVADIVLLVGDLTNFGRWRDAAQVVQAVRAYNDNILAVTGNCDHPEIETYLTDEGINLHRKCVNIAGVAFLGVCGSLPCPGKTLNEHTENDYKTYLKTASAELAPDIPLILVAHQPPYRTVTDFAWNGRHVGSRSIREFITRVQPRVCFTGHIHEGRGVDTIGETWVVNPGPLSQGGYGYVEVNTQVEIAEIRGQFVK
jgi:uncharacterized protein